MCDRPQIFSTALMPCALAACASMYLPAAVQLVSVHQHCMSRCLDMLMVELSRHFVGPHNSISALTIATQGSPKVDVHLTCSSSVHRL